MPPVLAIVADDLTGALDAAAPFAGRGLRVAVALGPDHVPAALARDPQVVAITTTSRDIPAEAARDAMARTMRALPPVPLFKKVDSRLKGNIEAELSVLDFQRALVAPAIPEFGRVVQAGAVQGFGVDDPIPVAARLGIHAARAEIPDVSSVDEMRAALASSDCDLMIGARGLADALAARMTGREMQMLDALPGPRGLFVIGSRDPITLEQVSALRAVPGLSYLGAPNGDVASPLPDARLLVVQALPASRPVAGDLVAARLAAAAAPLLVAGFGTALLTGGATAEAFLRQRGAGVLDLQGECLPGLVVADLDGLTIVTKSGGFGSGDSLVRVAAMIGGEA